MKTRCYTPAVQQLCLQYDQKLALLREDLVHFLGDRTEEMDSQAPFDKFEKRAELNAALARRCVGSVHK